MISDICAVGCFDCGVSRGVANNSLKSSLIVPFPHLSSDFLSFETQLLQRDIHRGLDCFEWIDSLLMCQSSGGGRIDGIHIDGWRRTAAHFAGSSSVKNESIL
jgi:hypothetical protein